LRPSQQLPLSPSPLQYSNPGSRSSSRGIPNVPELRFGSGDDSDSDGNDSEGMKVISG
jgi:hypothetical protein